MTEGREGMGDKKIRDDWTTRNMTMSRDFREPTTQSGNQKRFWGWNSVPWHELNVTQRYSHTGTNMEDFHTRRSILRYWNTYSRNFHKADPAPWHKCHTKIQSHRNKHGRLISDGSSYVTETRTAEIYCCWSTECFSNITILKFSSYIDFFLH